MNVKHTHVGGTGHGTAVASYLLQETNYLVDKYIISYASVDYARFTKDFSSPQWSGWVCDEIGPYTVHWTP